MSPYDNMSVMNQSPNNFNQPNNFGGYPYGYPPSVPPNPYQSQYSPYIDPNMAYQQYGGYVPGALGQTTVQDTSGNSMQVQPCRDFSQGGMSVSQGGFNPASGQSNGIICGSGFNPYGRFIGNPMYNAPQNPYNGYNANPYMRPYAMQNGYCYPQNQFDTYIQEILYQETPSVFDAQKMLEQVVLTEEERAKIDRNRNYITGTDYYGRPIYAQNAYQQNQQRQNDFETARKNYQEYFTKLSKIAHAFKGEEIDEEKMMKRFDPVPRQNIPQGKPFNYYTATEEEKERYNKDMMVARARDVNTMFANQEYMQSQLDARRAQAFAQIKASHDRLIGVEPGEHYDLKTYMQNGYKIGVNIEMEKVKKANRNASTKYSQTGYRGYLSRRDNSPVPITSKDDEYVSIEQLMKGVLDKNRELLRNQAIIQNSQGQNTYTSMPAYAGSAENIAHNKFMGIVEQKKELDQFKQAVR